MLQQTQVKTVIPFWNRWLHELPTIEAAAKAPSAKIHKLWEGLGYYTRVRNLQKAAQQIVAEQTPRRRRGDESQTENKSQTPHVVPYKFPEKFDEVLALPGIGRYTAGAICSIAFNQPTPLLDGNVIRVFTRIFGIAENPKEKQTNARLWQLAAELVARAATEKQKNACSHLNQSLMELGALICTPRKPQCLICPVKKLCVAFKENRTEELPNLGKRAAPTTRRFMAFAIEHKGKFLVRQRPAGVINAHLWEFPNVESNGNADAKEIFEINFDSAPFEIKPLHTVKHSITRYRITLEAFVLELKAAPPNIHGRWRTQAQMQRLAFTSAHRKILHALMASAGG
jgi:A/G-specific adenine glycosylase